MRNWKDVEQETSPGLDWDYQEVWKKTSIGWAPEPVFIVPKTYVTRV